MIEYRVIDIDISISSKMTFKELRFFSFPLFTMQCQKYIVLLLVVKAIGLPTSDLCFCVKAP